jgi:hypothetical protein
MILAQTALVFRIVFDIDSGTSIVSSTQGVSTIDSLQSLLFRHQSLPFGNQSIFIRMQAGTPTKPTSSTPLAGPLALSNIRSELIRLEETVIFALIERAQFPRNADIYSKPLLRASERSASTHGISHGGISTAINSTSMPYLDYFLHQTEMVV